jgi:hypothetical protein
MKTLPVSKGAPFDFSHYFYVIKIGFPGRVPLDIVTVSSEFEASKRILTRPRMERMLHSMLTSRVLLHIRAQSGDSCVRSDGLVELNTIRFP